VTPPPDVPGIPGRRLPELWEPRVTELERRVSLLEQNDSTTRAKLQSYDDFEEEDSKVTIPTDAPPRAKVVLGFASGLTPNGRLIIGLAIIAAIVALVLRGVKLF
jgi:hypothetical protein